MNPNCFSPASGRHRAISLAFSLLSCLVFIWALAATTFGQDRPDDRRQERRDERREEQREEPRYERREERRSGLTITDPIATDGGALLAPGSVEVSFRVDSDEIERVKVRVLNDDLDGSSKIEKIDPDKRENTITVKLFRGRNQISIVGLRGKKVDGNFYAELVVKCNGKKCKSGEESEESAAESEDEETPKPKKKPKPAAHASEDQDESDGDDDAKEKEEPLVKITIPSNDAVFQDRTFIDSNVVIQKKSKVERLLIQVFADNTTIDQGESLPIAYGDDERVTVTPRIKIGKGKNVIKVFNASKPLDEKAIATVTINCKGDCGSESEATGSSVNTRAIVGFEQAGASSATSETKPFLDLFFTGPLIDDSAGFPRLATWGGIRFSTTPEQTAAAGAFPSNLVNQVTEKNTVDLVQSFDFLAGMEYRLFKSKSYFPSLLPGVKQRMGVYLVGGGGAISPLTTKRESAQIFAVPSPENGQFELFKERFGEEAVAKKYIAFVLPERDRFLRQYYGGLRFKTYFFDKERHLINRFPAILDVMFGQNEAVTGGTFKNDVTDLSGKVIGKKRSWVFRLDGFYPLPVNKLSFLYLYGTAMMKVGGGGVHITTPLFLDTAPGDVLVTNNNVFVAPNLQLNRDYYKIGVGINLLELKPKPKN